MNTIPVLSAEELGVLADTFKLLGDPTRLKILLYCLQEPKAVSNIAETLALSQPLTSHHLRLLRAARLVKSERQSRQVFYTVADNHVADMLKDMASHIGEERHGKK